MRETKKQYIYTPQSVAVGSSALLTSKTIFLIDTYIHTYTQLSYQGQCFVETGTKIEISIDTSKVLRQSKTSQTWSEIIPLGFAT